MKSKLLHFSSVTFIGLSALSVLYVSILAFIDPQQVMNLVQVKLNNTDAYSSIRGVFGGVGIMIVAMLIFLSLKNITHALLMLVLLWGMYSISRIVTIFSEGVLGAFGNQWLIIETILFVIASLLALMQCKKTKAGN